MYGEVVVVVDNDRVVVSSWREGTSFADEWYFLDITASARLRRRTKELDDDNEDFRTVLSQELRARIQRGGGKRMKWKAGCFLILDIVRVFSLFFVLFGNERHHEPYLTLSYQAFVGTIFYDTIIVFFRSSV